MCNTSSVLWLKRCVTVCLGIKQRVCGEIMISSMLKDVWWYVVLLPHTHALGNTCTRLDCVFFFISTARWNSQASQLSGDFAARTLFSRNCELITITCLHFLLRYIQYAYSNSLLTSLVCEASRAGRNTFNWCRKITKLSSYFWEEYNTMT